MLSTERFCPGPSDEALEAVHTKAVAALGSPSVAAAPAAGATAWFAGAGPDDAQASLVAQVSNAAVAVTEAAGGLSNLHVCGRQKLRSTGHSQCLWCRAVRSGHEQRYACSNQELRAFHRPSAIPSVTDTVDGHGLAPWCSRAPVEPLSIIEDAVFVP